MTDEMKLRKQAISVPKYHLIPIQLTCLACFSAHTKYHTLNGCERFGHASLHTNPLSLHSSC